MLHYDRAKYNKEEGEGDSRYSSIAFPPPATPFCAPFLGRPPPHWVRPNLGVNVPGTGAEMVRRRTNFSPVPGT